MSLVSDPVSVPLAGRDTPVDAPIRGRLLPWSCLLTVFAGLCLTVGILWDISWHSTIGRDNFWTPAHIMVYLGGSLGGLVGGWLVLQATFWRRQAMASTTVGVLGFRGPIGAWVAIWGASAMLISAPFDDWWHNAYGLDVRILSPPHVLLALGMYHVVMGAVILAWSWMNNSSQPVRARYAWFLTFAVGIQLTLASMLILEISLPNRQRSAAFLIASALLFPGILASAGRCPSVKWPATRVALVYLVLFQCLGLVLPLFPAEPKLAPVLNRVTHMVPPMFPLLLFVPALGMDWVLRRAGQGQGWRRDMLAALGCGIVFVALYSPTQWYFAEFLLGPGADNAFFHGHGRYFGYGASPGAFRFEFWRRGEVMMGWSSLLWGTFLAAASSWIGISASNFMAKVRR